jgi:flagellar hook-length control protein FliK
MAPDSALQPAGQLVVERAAPSTSTDISRSDDKPAAQSADAPPADVAPLPYALAPLVVAASPTPATMMASEPTPAEIAAVSAPLPQAQALRPVPAAAPGADDGDEAAFAVAADPPAAAISRAGRTLAAANAPAEMQASATAEVFATATAAGPGRKPPAPAVRLHDAAAPGGPDMTPFAAGPAERATAAPVLAPAVAPTVLATQPARLAHDLGLAIARQVSADGNVLHIRVEPAELGRIDVRMSFDDSGNLRAIVGADSSVALDLLRRDSADLGRAMADAGVRADSQSFRFESRGDGRGSDGGSPRPPPQRFAGIDPDILPETPDPAQFKPLRWRGRVDILA